MAATTEEEAPYYETKAGVAAYREKNSHRENFNEHIRYFTIRSLMGEISGKSVLDLGCGDGQLCEKIIEWGACKVAGYDRSQKMIDECKRRQLPNTEYTAADCVKLGKLEEQFDIATSVFVIHYLNDFESLLAYAKVAYVNIKPGGRLIGITSAFEEDFPLSGSVPIGNMHFECESHEEYSKVVSKFGDATKPTLTITHYSLRPSTIEKALKEAGFHDFKWHPVMLSEDGRKYFDEHDVREQLTTLRPFLAIKGHE